MAAGGDRSSRPGPKGRSASGPGPRSSAGGAQGRSRNSSKGAGSGGSTGSGPRKAAGGGGRAGGPPRRSTGGRRSDLDPIPGNQAWGGLARKGALRATHDDLRSGEETERRLRDDELDPEAQAKRADREARRQARQERTDDLRAQARTAVARATESAPPPRPPRPRRAKPARERAALGHGRARNEDESEALHRLLGPVDAKKQLRKLRAAAQSYEAERYSDALKSLRAIAELAPGVPEVRELHGLTLYRMGRYRAAAKELEAFRELADSAEQNPVLADCYRADERWADVAELWDELGSASPGAAVVNEGRIVMAGALADQGDIDGAVRLLEKGWKRPSQPAEHHLRRAYALADLYERSGDLPRARALFDWVVGHDREFVDAKRRLQSLR